MRYLLIVNPNSGKKNFNKRLKQIRLYFYKHKMRLRTMFTRYPGHATELARKFGARYDVVIGAGGDGTINEVINGVIGTGARLGIIPWGTGNVFAKEMGIYAHPILSSRIIRKGESVLMDLGKVNGRYFLMMAGIGFDAYSLKQLDTINLKPWIGRLTYVVGGLKAFARYRYPKIKIVVDNKIKDEGSFILVSNTSLYGSFFKLSPCARPNDGLLDIFVYHKRGGLGLLQLLSGVLFGVIFPSYHRRVFFKNSTSYRGRHIYLYADEPVLTQLDGDLGSTLPAVVEIQPAAIDVILPARQIRKLKK